MEPNYTEGISSAERLVTLEKELNKVINDLIVGAEKIRFFTNYASSYPEDPFGKEALRVVANLIKDMDQLKEYKDHLMKVVKNLEDTMSTVLGNK